MIYWDLFVGNGLKLQKYSCHFIDSYMSAIFKLICSTIFIKSNIKIKNFIEFLKIFFTLFSTILIINKFNF